MRKPAALAAAAALAFAVIKASLAGAMVIQEVAASPAPGPLAAAPPQTAVPPVDVLVPSDAPVAGRDLYEAIKRNGAISEDDAKTIEAAAELNPALYDYAARRAIRTQTPAELLASRQAMRAFTVDIRARARLQAFVSEVIPVGDTLRTKLQPLFADVAATDRSTRSLPVDLAAKADAALASHQFVIRPLCPSALATLFKESECIDDPWSRLLFRSVVPISVDGRRTCTGTAIGPRLVLTAAHCVIVQGGDQRTIVSAGRINVGARDGSAIALRADPKVPPEMLAGDCLPDCFDMRFDFAVLETDASRDGGWTPLSVLTRLPAPGDVPITIGGYGISNLPASSATGGLFIGAQKLHLAATSDAFRWTYSFSPGALSSSCGGDSGGPIFYGRPRKDGDILALIGVISKIETSTCFETSAVAVNLTMPGPAKALCAMLPADVAYCKP